MRLVSIRPLARFARLARKELRETLRDRRTILTLVLMPLLVYPVLGLTFEKFLLSQALEGELGGAPEYLIAFEDQTDAIKFRDIFIDTVDRMARERKGDSPKAALPTWEAVLGESGAATDVEAAVASGYTDIGLRWSGESGQPPRIQVLYDPNAARSREAMEALENVVRGFNAEQFRRRLRRAGESDAPPVQLDEHAVEAKIEGHSRVATLIPFVLLLMTATGAVYPAIDLTAGERERGTLEALMAAPASARAVLGAKYVAVFAVAVMTAGMNLIAMTATAYSLGLDQFLFHEGITASAIGLVAGLVVIMAAFFSACVLLVTSFARSFKEAQAYLIPLMMLALAPGVVSLMPDLALSLPLAVTPLVGVVLLARDMLTGGTTGLMALACVGSTILYAGVALLAASRVFGTDAVLYGSGGTWRELFERPDVPRGVPPATMAAAALAVVFPMFLLLGPLPARWSAVGMPGQLLANSVLTILMFLVVPSVAATLCRASWRETFAQHQAGIAGWIGAAMLGASLWPFAFEIEVLLLSSERVEALEKLFAPIRQELRQIGLPLKLFALALVPAVCEEWFFRGFLLSSMRGRMGGISSVLATALLFGIFHVVVRNGLFLERLVPTAFLGLVLGWTCVATGSLWPGMILHALHNGLLLTVAHFEESLAAWGWGGGQTEHLPPTWLVAAGLLAAGGALLVAHSGMRPPRAPRQAVGVLYSAPPDR